VFIKSAEQAVAAVYRYS